jgi:hypothetical protein
MGYLKIIIFEKDFGIFLPAIYQQIFALKSLLKITMLMWFSFL